MAQSTREIKRRIKSVNNTKQITRAMEMVAAAKLRRAQERVVNNRPYEKKMRTAIYRILHQARDVSHPLMETQPEDAPTAYIVMAADRGLCGGYNVNVVKKAEEHIGGDKENVKIIAVGKYARDYFRKRHYNVIMEYVDIEDYPDLEQAKRINESVVQMFFDGVFGELHLVYSEFFNAMIQRPVARKMLPMSKDAFMPLETEESEAERDPTEELAEQLREENGLEDQIYKFEPSAEEVLGGLLTSYLLSSVFRALLESKASEQGARMSAMKNATDNAEDMIEELTLTYNKARQGAITQEILEIVSGAEALK